MPGSIRSLLRSLASAVVQLGEDPELLLEHLYGDLRALAPQLDAQLAWTASGLRLLERELAEQDRQEDRLGPAATKALAEGRTELARSLAASLEALKQARAASRAQLEVLEQAHRLALETKRGVLARVQERCREVAAYLPPEQEAHWRSRVAAAVEELARAHLDPDLEERIAAIEAAAQEAEQARPVAREGAEAPDLEAEARRLEELPGRLGLAGS